MQKGNLYTIFFILAVAFISALLLSGTASLLKERQNLNIELDRKSNILTALGFPLYGGKEFCVSDPSSGKETRMRTLQCYNRFIREIVVNSKGEIITGVRAAELSLDSEFSQPAEQQKLPVFIRLEGERASSYCVPVYGKGLWGSIYGYIALESDLNTIRGITFYKHSETPGLGAEIEQDWFRNGFSGKKIFSPDGVLKSVSVIKGGVRPGPEADYQVDGITSATITGEAVARLVKNSLRLYEPYFKKIRGGGQ